MTAEADPFDRTAMNKMFDLAEQGVAALSALQRDAVSRGM